jgi:acyl-CoA hydrolase
MKKLLMIAAFAVAANFAAYGVQTASANDAHHSSPVAKGKKAKKLFAKKMSVKKSGMRMNCPMMARGMMRGGGMTHGAHGMMHAHGMRCRMMGGARHMGMMHGPGSHMGQHAPW